MDGMPPPVPFSGLPDDTETPCVTMSGVVYLTRGVSSGFSGAQRIDGDGGDLDWQAAQREHDKFVADLKTKAGALVTVVEIDADPHQPDCVFVEDTLVALPGRGVLQCAPHDSRAGEVGPVANAARSVEFQFPPGKVTVDGVADAGNDERIEGGDVLYVRGGDDVYHHYFVGVGNRSNRKGAEALRKALSVSLGQCASKKIPKDVDESSLFRVHEIDMSLDKTWLHLKSAVTWAPYVGFVTSSETCPIYQACFEKCKAFEATTTNLIHDEKPCVVPRNATNVLALPGNVLFAHPSAATEIKKKGKAQVTVYAVEQPELAKADGALTCGVVVLDPFFEWTGFS
jgi:N-dimethylarginine dimethylaminohydrolase|tara:strand:- start:4684 stop:5709 length:1026 start_codon:yes stop_codon:yes gene_type:complete|mmetsp:Transcript_8005/g.26572  ORF Transcript_8005/g.26572 Transcript_8005/m.26572 type:complete len:342 (-) Transcript_8005:45-1070(-)